LRRLFFSRLDDADLRCLVEVWSRLDPAAEEWAAPPRNRKCGRGVSVVCTWFQVRSGRSSRSSAPPSRARTRS